MPDALADAAPTSAAPAFANNAAAIAPTSLADAPFTMTAMADFNDPWSLAFLPGNAGLLVTEKSGQLLLWRDGSAARVVAGTPDVAFAGQGGLGDVVLHPAFAANRLVYLSWAEAGQDGTSGAAVGRGRLSADGARLEDFATIWRQEPFVTGNGHFGHRIAFGPDGMLYISSGERQQFTPAQNDRSNLGKILRLNADGSVPADNPLADQAARLSNVAGPQAAAMRQIWSLGHRNPLGIAFAGDQLWEVEMGPAGGDELNRIERGGNYGYPLASNGNHYDGRDIPDHAPGDGYHAPAMWWNPVINPADLMIYSGPAFPQWRGNAFIASLSDAGLIRVNLTGARAVQADRWATGFRVRSVEQGPDGAIWLLEDGATRGQGRLFRLDLRDGRGGLAGASSAN